MNIALLREYLVPAGLLDPDEPWFRDMILYLNRTVRVLGGAPRPSGAASKHRALGRGHHEGDGRSLGTPTPLRLPLGWITGASSTRTSGEFRDIPPNDTGYYFGVLYPLVLFQHLTGEEEFFTHPEMRLLWDRMAYEVTPDGSVNPWGAHGGFNSTAAYRVFMLELAAAHTRDAAATARLPTGS